MDKIQLRQKYESVAQLFNKQEGVQDHFVQEKARLFLEIAEHNEFLDSKDEVQNVLHELQRRTQSRTKDIYENLLTSLIKDVMPDNDESDSVVLNTGVRNNKTTLSVEVANSEGFARDVYLDKGGSIENIIAMGLRFIALSRTANRRFLILDEADAWLKDIYIPAFAEVLCQLSKRVGIQVVYISHHSVENFMGKAKIVNLTRENRKIVADDIAYENDGEFEGVDDKNLPDLMEGVGIKYLRLVNVKQHENTLIELSPNVTIITGDNDIGKTTILQAIEAVNQNNGRDGLIRDGQPYCRVEMGLEDDLTLSWSYRRKGQKKTSYVLTDEDGTDIKTSNSGKDTPDWLHDYLAMGLYQDFDLHIGDQHNASFILDKKISTHRRAEILSLGKEASKVQKMITLHGEMIRTHKQDLKRKQQELNLVKNKLSILRSLAELIDKMNGAGQAILELEQDDISLKDITTKAQVINQLSSQAEALKMIDTISVLDRLEEEKEDDMEKVISRLTSLEGRFNAISPIADLSQLEQLEHDNFDAFERSIARVEKLHAKATSLSLVEKTKQLEHINIDNIEDLMLKGHQASSLQKKLDKLSEALNIPQLENISNTEENNDEGILRAGSKASDLIARQKQLLENIKAEQANADRIGVQLEEHIESMGGVCPTCNAVIGHSKECA